MAPGFIGGHLSPSETCGTPEPATQDLPGPGKPLLLLRPVQRERGPGPGGGTWTSLAGPSGTWLVETAPTPALPLSRGGPALPGRGTVGPPQLLGAFTVWQRPHDSSLPARTAVRSVVWVGHGREPYSGHLPGVWKHSPSLLETGGSHTSPRPGSSPTLPSLHFDAPHWPRPGGRAGQGALLCCGGVSPHFLEKQAGFSAGLLVPLRSLQMLSPTLPQAPLPPLKPWQLPMNFGTGWDPDGGERVQGGLLGQEVPAPRRPVRLPFQSLLLWDHDLSHQAP